jgi:hypothetical protein
MSAKLTRATGPLQRGTMALDAEHFRAQIADIEAYDRLGPETRRAIREICCPVVARQTLAWVLRSAIPDAKAAAFIRSQDEPGRMRHWAIMERDAHALTKGRLGRLQR